MLCTIRELAANKCNYGREAMQATYSAVNLATHVMSVLVSTLCGCLHVGSHSVCVLGTIPYTCVYPYNVYSKMFRWRSCAFFLLWGRPVLVFSWKSHMH